MLLIFPGLTVAQGASFVLVAPAEPLAAGATAHVWLCCLNDSSNVVSQTFPPAFTGMLVAGAGSTNVAFVLSDHANATTDIAPQAFAKCEYAFSVPGNFNGPARLEVDNYNSVILHITNAAPTNALGVSKSDNETFQSSFTNFLGTHIFPYEPIYFLLGTYPAAEFQFSLKYRVFDLASPWNPVGHFYFAYTQTSFWDLLTRDPSFYDTSYKPSAFLFYPNVNRGETLRLDLQGGVEHESNGRGGSMERALNTAYFQPTFNCQLARHLELDLQPRVWGYLSVNPNNEDMRNYRGYADLRTALSWRNDAGKKQAELATRFRLGADGEHPGWLVDLRFNLPRTWVFNPAIDLQYFNGYGQTLRQYDIYSHGLRAGLCLWY